MTASQLEALIRPPISRFGKDSFYDMRLCLELQGLFSPLDLQVREESKWNIELVELIAKIQVDEWLRDQSKLERMLWFTVWSESREDQQDFSLYTRRKMLDSVGQPGDSDFWRKTRKFMYLCLLTNEFDRISQLSPSKVHFAFPVWRKALKTAAKTGRIRASQMSPTFVIRPVNLNRQNGLGVAPSLNLELVPQVPFLGMDRGNAISPREFRDLR